MIFRHPEQAKRPSFLDIVVALQKPDFQILKLSEEGVDKLSNILGAGLETSKDLYVDLQNAYRKCDTNLNQAIMAA